MVIYTAKASLLLFLNKIEMKNKTINIPQNADLEGILANNPTDDSDKIMTREEVCKLLKVSKKTLFNWSNDKLLVNHKIGRRVYYMKADVMAKLTNLKNLAK